MPSLPHATATRPAPVELLRVGDVFANTRTLRDPARYHRVRAGVYAPRAAWDQLAPWDRYLARVHAYALVNPGAVFAYESAAALIGLPIFGEPTHIHIYDLGRTKSRCFGDVFVHTNVESPEMLTLGAHTMTSVATTAVDLMRVLPAPFGLAVGDAAISPVQGGTLTRTDLESIAAAQPSTRGGALLRLLLATLDPRSESPGEGVSRAVILWSGFERPELQRTFVLDGFTDRVDFWWESVRAISESDGYRKYLGETSDDTVKRVLAEKRREDRLRRQSDAFGRWDWRSAISVEPVVRELERLRVPRVGAPRTLLLSTMARNPRSFPRRTAARPGRG